MAKESCSTKKVGSNVATKPKCLIIAVPLQHPKNIMPELWGQPHLFLRIAMLVLFGQPKGNQM